jgi:HSP20 family protein
MAITRWTNRNPWRDLDALTNRLGLAFEDSFPTPATSGAWLPAVNVEETAEELVLTAELPGLTRDDVELEVENNILTLRGEKIEERREGDENKKFHLWERTYGTFQRSFTLPRTVKADNITADFEKGVLHVHMPKVPEAKGRRISIGHEGNVK